MKGQKRRKREEKFDKEGEEEENVEKSGPEEEEGGEEEEKTATEIIQNGNLSEGGERAEELAAEVPSIPIILSEDGKKANKRGVIFILEKASLEVAKVGKVCFFFYSLRE